MFLFGEDIAEASSPFGATAWPPCPSFGQDRIRDTPISEAAMANAAVGAALSGLRPVLEIMFMDFMTLAMDALVNQAAKGASCSADWPACRWWCARRTAAASARARSTPNAWKRGSPISPA